MIIFCLLLLTTANTVLMTNAYHCGVSKVKSGKVIGGSNALPGQWPWQVAISFQKKFLCGGSLIRPDWVLTASHCIDYETTPSFYDVVVGEHNRSKSNAYRETIPAKKVIMHPNYNSPVQLNNDIALIQLARPVRFTNRVNTVCLPRKGKTAKSGSKCFITGWGKIKPSGIAHHILQMATLPVLSIKECKKKLAKSEYGDILNITNQMLCAEDPGTIKSGCHGDSGGPLVCDNGSGKFVQHGVVSWGSPKCNISELATVFARVSTFTKWISKTIRTTMKPPPPFVSKTPVPPSMKPAGLPTLANLIQPQKQLKQSTADQLISFGIKGVMKLICIDQFGKTCVDIKKKGHCQWFGDECALSCKQECKTERERLANTTATPEIRCVDTVSGCEHVERDGFCKEMTDHCTLTCHPKCADARAMLPKPTPRKAVSTRISTLAVTSPPTRPTPKGNCGRTRIKQSKIVHGSNSKEGAWPWHASLQENGDHFCGGTLITPEWVLTAAHCVDDIAEDESFYRGIFKIILGNYDKNKTPAKLKQVKDFKQVIVHETWEKRFERDEWHDVALIQLKTPAKLNKRVNTACLPRPGDRPKLGDKCYFTGWGMTNFTKRSKPDVLQQARLPVVEAKHCHNAKNIICTGYGIVKAANACKGDSGGPLVCRNTDSSWTVHGVASFVKEYCKYYTGFADVSKYRDWIRKFIPETLY